MEVAGWPSFDGLKSDLAHALVAVTLPATSDLIAQNIGESLIKNFKCDLSILISDTHGRALRRGAINVAIGSYNFSVIDDARERKDIFGYNFFQPGGATSIKGYFIDQQHFSK